MEGDREYTLIVLASVEIYNNKLKRNRKKSQLHIYNIFNQKIREIEQLHDEKKEQYFISHVEQVINI